MGLFGGGRKAAERAAEEDRIRKLDEADSAEIDKSAEGWDTNIDEWLSRVEASRPAGATALTNEVLAEAGPCPMPPIPAKHARHMRAYMVMARAKGYAAESASRRGVKVGAAGDLDQSRYWTSVSNYVSGL